MRFPEFLLFAVLTAPLVLCVVAWAINVTIDSPPRAAMYLLICGMLAIVATLWANDVGLSARPLLYAPLLVFVIVPNFLIAATIALATLGHIASTVRRRAR